MKQITFEQLPQAVNQLFEKLSSIETMLLTQGNTTQQQTNELLTIQQAAAFLSLSVPTLYSLVSRQSIPVSKQGKRLYFSQSELVGWVKSGRKLTISEIDSQAGSNLAKRKGGKNA